MQPKTSQTRLGVYSASSSADQELPAPVNPESPALATQSELPLAWILDPAKPQSLANRVLARLVQAEAHEPDVWLREDYRQAWITVSLAQQGHAQPFVEASYIMYGMHPDKLWPAIKARRAAMLGPEIIHDIKKPCASVKPRKEGAA